MDIAVYHNLSFQIVSHANIFGELQDFKFFFEITQYNPDTHNIHTHTPMNTRTQTLPL